MGLCLRFLMALSNPPLPSIGSWLAVDDLQYAIDENLGARRQAAEQAEEIINTQVENFLSWMRSQGAQSTITDFRQQAEQIRAEVVNNARIALKNGTDPERVIEQLAHLLTNKLLHTPSIQIRQAGINERHDLIAAARELFKLTKTNQIK